MNDTIRSLIDARHRLMNQGLNPTSVLLTKEQADDIMPLASAVNAQCGAFREPFLLFGIELRRNP